MVYRPMMHLGLGPVLHLGRPVMMIVCVVGISARTGPMRLGPVNLGPVGRGMSAAGTVVGDMLAAAAWAIVVIRLVRRLSLGRPSASVSSAMAFALFGALLF